jgi:hypothetical protein
MQSQLTSSLVETSEDEERRKRDAEKKKEKKRGFTSTELDEPIDVELKETETQIMLIIPSRIVLADTPDEIKIQEDFKKYQELLQNKKGSDSYMMRGTQTINLAHKHKSINYIGFSQEDKQMTASNFDIVDASKIEKISDSQQQLIDYEKQINEIMAEKLKDSRNLFDTEAPASHLSINTSKSDVKGGKSGSNSTKGDRSKMKSS